MDAPTGSVFTGRACSGLVYHIGDGSDDDMEVSMKIPASKVPAQVWADKVKKQPWAADVQERECLEHWEGSKQVYRINDALWDEVALDEDSELPASAFKMLPYDCIFIQHREEIAIPLGDGMRILTEREGYFCWLDGDILSIAMLESERKAQKGEVEFNPPHSPILMNRFDLGRGETVGEILKGERAEGMKTFGYLRSEKDAPYVTDDHIKKMVSGLTDGMRLNQVLGSLMYISSKEADVRTVYVPQRNPPRKSRQTDCTVHDAGFRVAPQLAEVRRYRAAEGHVSQKTGRHVAPHVRRAHWHGYLTGPRENPTGLEIKWIAPVVVNGKRGEPEGVIHDLGKGVKEGSGYTVSTIATMSRGSAKRLDADRGDAGREQANPSGRETR